MGFTGQGFGVDIFAFGGGKWYSEASWIRDNQHTMMTSSNGNIFRVTGHLCGEFTGPRWIPRTKASDAELWCFLWSASESTVEQTIVRLLIWDAHYDVTVVLFVKHIVLRENPACRLRLPMFCRIILPVNFTPNLWLSSSRIYEWWVISINHEIAYVLHKTKRDTVEGIFNFAVWMSWSVCLPARSFPVSVPGCSKVNHDARYTILFERTVGSM